MPIVALLSGTVLFVCAIATVVFVVGLLGQMNKVKKIDLALLAIAFVLLSVLLIMSFLGNTSFMTSRSWYLLPLTWSLLLIGFIGYFWFKLDMIALTVAPLSFLLLFAGFVFQDSGSTFNATFSGPIFLVHLALIFIGIGCMALASGAGLVFIWQENRLKKKQKLTSLSKDVPSLWALDRVNYITTFVGFPMYLLGILSGFSWAYVSWGTVFSGDPKEIVSLFILGLYGYLFHRRQAHNATGRKPAILAIIVFMMSLVSIVFVNTLLPTHHRF